MTTPVPVSPPVAPGALSELVIATIAEVTRYPRSVLRPEAELEDELGIESVKRAEILGALGSKLGIAPPENGSLGGLKTIADVVAAACRAAGKLGNRASVETMIKRLDDPALRSVVIESLENGSGVTNATRRSSSRVLALTRRSSSLVLKPHSLSPLSTAVTITSAGLNSMGSMA